MTEKEKIKQEIERRIDLYSIAEKDDSTFARMGELSSLIDFIDSLPEEPTSEDLEEEIDTFFSDWLINLDEHKDFVQIARYFAEWGRNHFEDKSKMVSDETTIVNDWQYGKDPDHSVIPAIHKRIEGFSVGDKVKIIIIKQEQK